MSHLTSLGDIVDEVHNINESTFVSEVLLPKPLSPNSDFSRQINFEFDVIKAAPYGGSLAVLHSSNSENLNKLISIYDSMLNFVGNVELVESLHDFYITADETLVVIFNTPSIAVYDQRGNQILYHALSEQREYIVASAFWEFGAFISTFAGNVYYISDFSKLNITKFATDEDVIPNLTYTAVLPPKPGEHGPILWGIKPSDDDEQSHLVCVQKNSVKVIEYADKIVSFQFSSDYSMVVVLTNNSVDICDEFFRCVNVRLTFSDLYIKSAAWCGTSTILINTNEGLKMVGQSPQPCNFNISSDCFVITEIDGARVITKNNIVYIREVSDVALDFIHYAKSLTQSDKNNNKSNVASKSPSIQLYTTVSVPEDFARSDPLQVLNDVMDEAINGLLDAARFFRRHTFVRQILAIVIRYKDKCQHYDIEKYLKVLSDYRIISQIANSPINMPLTIAQFEQLGNERLVIRLCNRYLHFAAMRIAENLNVRSEIVGTHWAHCLIHCHSPNDVILDKLKLNESLIDRVELANCSFDLSSKLTDPNLSYEKEKLGLALLKSVPVKSRTVPLLIKRGEWQEAVEAAVESNDASLLVFVLKAATDQNQDAIVRQCITKHPSALSGWLSLHPDESERADLYEKSGQLRKSIFYRYKQGQTPEELVVKAKEAGDTFDMKCFANIIDIKNACKEFGFTYDPTLTAYQIFDRIVESKDPKSIKSAAKILKLEPDEVFTRRIEVAERICSDENDLTSMIGDAVKDASQEVLFDTFSNLMDDNKKNIAVILSKFITEDDYTYTFVQERLNKE